MSAPTIGLIAATLPEDSQSLLSAPIGDNTWLASYDPARLSFDLVKRVLLRHFGPGATIITGIPA
jgi:hypothetical protein